MKKTLNWLFDYPNLQIYQFEDGFKFSLDSLLLAEFAEIKKNEERILDLCTGNGVIPTILAYKYHKKIIGIELQKEIYNLAVESIKLNKLEELAEFICDDVKNIDKHFPRESFDVILCNPPYFPYHNENHVNDCELKKIARHEIYINLATVFKIAGAMLKNKGRFYLVHLPERLSEIVIYAHENHLFLKKIQFIYSKDNENAKIVLCMFTKNGRMGTKVLPNINISKVDTYQNLFKERSEEK